MAIVPDVQLTLNDAGVFWPLPQILDAVNEAQFDVFTETKWALTSAPLLLTTNADIFRVPTAIQIPKWIEGTNSYFQPAVVKRFFPSSARNLEHFLRTWRGDNRGQPAYFVIWDERHWRCYPRPDNQGTGPCGAYPFTIYGVGLPVEITDTTQSILGPSNYVLGVKNLAVAILLEATRPDLADIYLAQSADQILAFKKRLRNNQSHNIRQLRPATGRLEIEQSGLITELPSYYPLET